MNATTDTHTALPTSREENYFGKYQHTEPSPERHNREVIPAEDPALRIMTSQEAASGLTAVWARENTRDDIFDALKRKEVYATTGTRIRVRVFGGWDFAADDLRAARFHRRGLRRGVPMGGDLQGRPSRQGTELPDPGAARSRMAPISTASRSSRAGLTPRARPTSASTTWPSPTAAQSARTAAARSRSGSTVDIRDGDLHQHHRRPRHWPLIGTDPDFDPNEHAFYYVRVLEIPTPRWTTYDAAFFGIPLPDTVPATIQDRAYTSPIWYTP